MRRLWHLAVASILFACGTSPVSPADQGDGGVDATVDALGEASDDDALTDAGLDATVDADAAPPSEAGPDAPLDAPRDALTDGPTTASNPCQLPGAIQFTAAGKSTVPGGSASWPDLSFLTLPAGFCAHYFGTVGNARQLRFAPGGELFVASPTTGTTGGGSGGQSAIVLLPDDDLDGVADSQSAFLGSLPSTQGLLFTGGFLYYQDHTAIMRLPYATGQRVASGTPELVADVTVYTSGIHWPKTLDVADDGAIYVGNGGDQGESCDPAHPFHGGILSVGDGGAIPIAKGLRNPIAVRCARGHDRCFALELAKDYSGADGGVGREKLIPIRPGDDWGFPCCATTGLPYPGGPAGTDCSAVTAETNGFLIGDTPFGVDFEGGHWSGTWAGRAYVVTHGAAGNWSGARMVAIPMDANGLPTPSTDTGGSNVGMVDFATGWDDQTMAHGRPAAVAFAADGRLFVGNDNDGTIFWIGAM